MKEDVFLKQASSVDRVSGESEKVVDFKNYIETTFANQNKEPWELEKSEEDKEVILLVLKEMPTFLEKYGGHMPPLTLNHFHAVDIDLENSPRLKGDAGFQSKYQRIIYSSDALAQEPRLSRAQIIAHEIMHFCSYQYFKEGEVSGGGTMVGFKRVGLKMAGREEYDLLEEVSGKIDEAVMDELSIRFAKEFLSKDPWFLEDLPSSGQNTDLANTELADGLANELEIEQFAGQSNDQTKIHAHEQIGKNNSLHELKKDESGNFYFQPNSHAKEIRVLNNLIKYVVAKKPEIYKSEEDVFDLFAKAALTNNLMPLLRALRSGMGKNWLSTIKLSLAKK